MEYVFGTTFKMGNRFIRIQSEEVDYKKTFTKLNVNADTSGHFHKKYL